jgi:hypothetical protein
MEIKNWITGAVIFTCEETTIKATLIKAVSEGANLEWANLKGANVKGANLKGAHTEYCTINFSKHEKKQAMQFMKCIAWEKE